MKKQYLFLAIGAGIAYYLWKQSPTAQAAAANAAALKAAAANPANAPTSQELAQSAAATLQANLNTLGRYAR